MRHSTTPASHGEGACPTAPGSGHAPFAGSRQDQVQISCAGAPSYRGRALTWSASDTILPCAHPAWCDARLGRERGGGPVGSKVAAPASLVSSVPITDRLAGQGARSCCLRPRPHRRCPGVHGAPLGSLQTSTTRHVRTFASPHRDPACGRRPTRPACATCGQTGHHSRPHFAFMHLPPSQRPHPHRQGSFGPPWTACPPPARVVRTSVDGLSSTGKGRSDLRGRPVLHRQGSSGPPWTACPPPASPPSGG